MTDDEQLIRAAWRGLGGSEREADGLLARHREPHRRYHTVHHVAFVLRTVDELLVAHQVDQPDTVRVAALYHDIVYDPTANDNEARSADLATHATATDLGWEPEACAQVHRLILATARHEAHDLAEGVLLDADLGVLGASPAAYARYAHAVREEYAHVDETGWRSGRADVLQSLLDRGRIYLTDTMYARAERRARVNLAAEIAALRP